MLELEKSLTPWAAPAICMSRQWLPKWRRKGKGEGEGAERGARPFHMAGKVEEGGVGVGAVRGWESLGGTRRVSRGVRGAGKRMRTWKSAQE